MGNVGFHRDLRIARGLAVKILQQINIMRGISQHRFVVDVVNLLEEHYSRYILVASESMSLTVIPSRWARLNLAIFDIYVHCTMYIQYTNNYIYIF